MSERGESLITGFVIGFATCAGLVEILISIWGIALCR
jgi:hypothetical protein